MDTPESFLLQKYQALHEKDPSGVIPSQRNYHAGRVASLYLGIVTWPWLAGSGYWEGKEKPSVTGRPGRRPCGEYHSQFEACNECDYQEFLKYEF